MVQHQVHNVEGAGADLEEEEAGAPDADTEKDEEWEQQAGWGTGTVGQSGQSDGRGRRQVLEDGQEDAPEVARVEQAGVSGKAQALREKAAAEPYEKRQMLWKGPVWQTRMRQELD